MLKPKIPLQAFSAAIAQSISKANEMLQTDHKIAIQRHKSDQFGMIMPPPPPLMIQSVRVKFRGNVSKSEQNGELFIDLNKPDGNFSAELDFSPFSEDMLKAAKNDGGRAVPFMAKPLGIKPEAEAPAAPPPLAGIVPQPQPAPAIVSAPQVEPVYESPAPQPDSPPPYYEQPHATYDISDTPRSKYSAEF